MNRNMLRKMSICLVVFAVHFTANALPISEKQAFNIATSFMKDRKFDNNRVKSLSYNYNSTYHPYYIFNDVNKEGFVIVSGESNTGTVLAYSYTGSFDTDNLPENVSWWLERCANVIELIKKQKISHTITTENVTRTTVSPLLRTQWGQNYPYNLKCPILNGEQCVTGCVATAVAQIMKYYNYPESSKATYNYRTRTNKISMPALPEAHFDWDNIKNSYSENSSDIEKDAVATLMQYCGCVLSMDYGIDGSGADATPVCDAMEYFFAYDSAITKIYRKDYSSDEWDEILYGELAKSRPVFYSGETKEKTGHAFVCDGYDNGYFHINWGWDGSCDGYFKLSILDPYLDSYSTDNSDAGYSSEQLAVINIVPKGYETIIEDMTLHNGYSCTYYNLNGLATAKLHKGINIIKMSDGTTRKVVVK